VGDSLVVCEAEEVVMEEDMIIILETENMIEKEIE
jgi:hypothetical protein